MDWRLPNVNEIESLVHAGVSDRAEWLNAEGFGNVQSDSYWSSTSLAAGPDHAYVVEMDTSRTIYVRKAEPSFYYAWPVRAGQNVRPDPVYVGNVWRTGQVTSYAPGDDGDLQTGVAWPAHRLVDQGDGTVVDSLTGLMWLKDADCFGPLNWAGALDAVADLNADPAGSGCAGYTAAYGDLAGPEPQRAGQPGGPGAHRPRRGAARGPPPL